MPSQELQWFPGHMARARRQIKENLSSVDAVVEVRDARAPMSSGNPEIQGICGKKPRIILLNKCDLADLGATKRWVSALSRESSTLAVDCRSGQGLRGFVPLVQTTLAGQLAANMARGMAKRPLRLMVLGIPNSGKSSFINCITNGKRAQVADRPGVTRRNQWYVAGRIGAVMIELLDTPGVLWPKFEDPEVGKKLAFLGSIKDEIIDIEELGIQFLTFCCVRYPDMLRERYNLQNMEKKEWELLEEIAKKRGMLLSGGIPDSGRAAAMILDELRSGKLGRVTVDDLALGGDSQKS